MEYTGHEKRRVTLDVSIDIEIMRKDIEYIKKLVKRLAKWLMYMDQIK